MGILQKIKLYLWEPRFHFSRFQFNLVAFFFVTIGLIIGTYFTISQTIPYIFAASSPWTQTNWSGGSGQISWSDNTKFYSSSNIVTSASGQITLDINIGDGADGAITVSTNKNINTDNIISGRGCADGGDAVNYSVITNTSSGQNQITLSSTPSSGCLAIGDEILIINLQSISASRYGKYETASITSISGTTLTLDRNLTNSYDGTVDKIVVQRVPNYTNVTIDNNVTLTANAWDGTKGGILFFRASGIVTNNGTINANSLGYRGGTAGSNGPEDSTGYTSIGGGGGGGGATTHNGSNYNSYYPGKGADEAMGGQVSHDYHDNWAPTYWNVSLYGAENKCQWQQSNIRIQCTQLSGYTQNVGGWGGDGSSGGGGGGGGGGWAGFNGGTGGNGLIAGFGGGPSMQGDVSPVEAGTNGTNGGGGGGGGGRRDSAGGGGGGKPYESAINNSLSNLSTMVLGGGAAQGGGGGGGGGTGNYSAQGGGYGGSKNGTGGLKGVGSIAGNGSDGENGNPGGGIIFISGNSINNFGLITANGGAGGNGGNGGSGGGGGGGGGAGGNGASGGTIRIQGKTVTLGSNLVTATGGNSGNGGAGGMGGNGGTGGNGSTGNTGSDGKIAVFSLNSISGNTVPTYGVAPVEYFPNGTLTSSIFDTEHPSDWGTLAYAIDGAGTTVVKVRSSNSATMVDAPDFSYCDVVTSGSDISSNNCVTDTHRYIQYQISLNSISASTPTFQNISIAFTNSDLVPPATNASAIAMTRTNGGTSVSLNGWTKNDSPYFSWTAGADNPGGSGVKGYCLYLGSDPDGNPATSKGLLGTSPVSTTGTSCQFIVSATSIDLATASYKSSTWLTSSNDPYYLNIKVIDNSGNVFTGPSTQFQFRFDNTPPNNTSYLSCASGSFSNVADMNFSWPNSGSAASSDDNAGLLGWQYQINSTSGTWLGITTESTFGVNNYVPTSESSRTLTQDQDGSSIVSGNNIVYFRTVDAAGNTSSDATIRTCNLSYGGAAPVFNALDTVTVSPTNSTTNSFALSWPEAIASGTNTVAHYYYMINTPPPSTLATLQGNNATYIDNGTATTVTQAALPNVNKGSNTIYVVAVDNASTPNYSPSNYITSTFTLNSTDPDNVSSLIASDSSIKSLSQWNVTLTWAAPTYQGAGNLSYLIYRSTDGNNFSPVGSTSGLSYVDNTPSSTQYYYKVYTKDGANAQSSGTNAVSITPTGKWTTAPSLEGEPTISAVSTRKATITWSTSRTADSKIQYGSSKGNYSLVEPSNSSQVTNHSIQLIGLNPGTTYYYKAKWTDEDGNTGTSEEKSFTTSSAPTIKDAFAKNIGLNSAIIQFTSQDASKVKIYYGTTTSFGGIKEISTSNSETTYTVELTGLLDGTKYYYKINTFDIDNSEYEGTVLDFTTLPRPKITNVKIQQVANTAQSTILVTWTTNTEISSIITYYPSGNTADVRDEVNVALTKGEHKMIIRGLAPQTDYILLVKGRDKIGNEAISDTQKVTTAIDTRPPQISELNVEGAVIPSTASTAQESVAQIIVSWNTDEPSTSQVEFGEGTGTTYSSKTQEDNNLTYNHLVIISGMTPSKVYHIRAISKDKAGNLGNSIDTVTITPKATENALNLVIFNLQEAFGFLGGLTK